MDIVKNILMIAGLLLPIALICTLFGLGIWHEIVSHRNREKQQKEFWEKMEKEREEAMSVARIRATQLHNEQVAALRRLKLPGDDKPWLGDGK